MSFTLKSGPQEYQPAFNPINFVVDSSNSGACSYKFIADLYVDGVLVTRLYAFPEGLNSYGVFRVDRIIQDYISYDLKKNLYGFSGNKHSIVQYYIEWREEYDTNSPCNGQTTVTGILSTSSTYFAWNGAIPIKDFPSFDQNEFLTIHQSARFLTNSPDIPIGIDQQFNLSFLVHNNYLISHAEIRTYSESGSLLGTFTITNNAQISDFHIAFGAGPDNLNNTTLATGAQPVIDSSVFTYTVALFHALSPGYAAASEVKTFTIDKTCSAFVTKQAWWLNRLGGFDALSFRLKSFRNLDISRTEYNKLLGGLNRIGATYLPGSGDTIDYLKSDRGRTILNVLANENLKWNTNWLTEDQGAWTEELFTSPEVYEKTPNDSVSYSITQMEYDSGFVKFTLSGAVQIPTGTKFYYSVNDASGVGAPNQGYGFITDHHNISTVRATINATINPTGTLIVGDVGELLPLIVKNQAWEEKLRANRKRIQYSIETVRAHGVNIQNQ